MRTLAKNVKETIGQPDSRLDVPVEEGHLRVACPEPALKTD